MLANIFLILSTTLVVYLDLKFRKIFNIILYPLMLTAIFINAYILGPIGITYSILGFVSGLLTCYLAYKLNLSEFGEFKLLGLIGIIKGYYFVLFVGSFSLLLIFLLYATRLIVSGKIKKIIQNSRVYLDLILEYGISVSTIVDEYIEKIVVPYSVIIFIAIFIVVGLGT